MNPGHKHKTKHGDYQVSVRVDTLSEAREVARIIPLVSDMLEFIQLVADAYNGPVCGYTQLEALQKAAVKLLAKVDREALEITADANEVQS